MTQTHIVDRLSIESYHKLDLGRRQTAILRAFQARSGIPATDRAIATWLGYREMNQVRPRISELIDLGILEKCGETLDMTTRRTVRVVRIKTCDGLAQRRDPDGGKGVSVNATGHMSHTSPPVMDPAKRQKGLF